VRAFRRKCLLANGVGACAARVRPPPPVCVGKKDRWSSCASGGRLLAAAPSLAVRDGAVRAFRRKCLLATVHSTPLHVYHNHTHNKIVPRARTSRIVGHGIRYAVWLYVCTYVRVCVCVCVCVCAEEYGEYATEHSGRSVRSARARGGKGYDTP
jgi:hypothetical protein